MNNIDTTKEVGRRGILETKEETSIAECCPECGSKKIGVKQYKEDTFLHTRKDQPVFWVHRKYATYRCKNPDCSVKTFTPKDFNIDREKPYTKEVEDMFLKELRTSDDAISTIAKDYATSEDVAKNTLKAHNQKLKNITTLVDCEYLFFYPFRYKNKDCLAVMGMINPLMADYLFLLDIYPLYNTTNIGKYFERRGLSPSKIVFTNDKEFVTKKRDECKDKFFSTNDVEEVYVKLNQKCADYITELLCLYERDPVLYIPYRFIKKEMEWLKEKTNKKEYFAAKSEALQDLKEYLDEAYIFPKIFSDSIRHWWGDYGNKNDDSLDKSSIVSKFLTPLYEEITNCEGEIYYSLEQEKIFTEEYKGVYEKMDKFDKIISKLNKKGFAYDRLEYRLLFATQALFNNSDLTKQEEEYIMKVITHIDFPCEQKNLIHSMISIDDLYKEIVEDDI